MASSNTVTLSDRVVEWFLDDATGSKGSSGALHWWSVANGETQPAPGVDMSGTYWNVKTITYIPAVATATGGWIQLNEKEAAGAILWRANFKVGQDVYSQTYDPPLRCRPAFWSSLSNAHATGSYFVFHLA